MLEIAGREANGGRGCAPVVCGTARAGPPIDAGRWSAWAAAAGQERAFVARRCRRDGRGTKRAPLVAGYGTCALETLAFWAFHPTRLETRTKESNMYASRWVANPWRRKETERWDPLGVHHRPTVIFCERFE